MVRHQTSARQPGFKAQHHGFEMHGTALELSRNGTYKSVPKDETTRAIAWLAGVSDEVAFMAAGQPIPGPSFAEELPPDVGNLPAKARTAAIDMLRVLVDMNNETADNTTHMNQAGARPATDNTSVSHGLNANFRSKVDKVGPKDTVPCGEPHARPDADSAGDIPLPANYYELAAESSRNYGAEEAARASTRGEETQETDGIDI